MKFPLLAQSDHLHFIPSPNRSRYCEDIWRNWLVEIWSYKLVTHRSGANQLWEAGSHTHLHASIGEALLVIHLGWQVGMCSQLLQLVEASAWRQKPEPQVISLGSISLPKMIIGFSSFSKINAVKYLSCKLYNHLISGRALTTSIRAVSPRGITMWTPSWRCVRSHVSSTTSPSSMSTSASSEPSSTSR